MSNDKDAEVKADAAITALFALEQALGPSDGPQKHLRLHVYQARILVDQVKHAVRSGKFP